MEVGASMIQFQFLTGCVDLKAIDKFLIRFAVLHFQDICLVISYYDFFIDFNERNLNI